MKYQHKFVINEKTSASRTYFADGKYVQLDFFEHMMRVAIYSKKDNLFPTFAICPGTSLMPKHGRNRLSTEGLKLVNQSSDTEFKIDEIDIKLDLSNFILHYYKDGEKFFSDREILAYNFGEEMGKGSHHYLSREKDEHIYGLGDKTGPINKNLYSFKMETFDALGFNANKSDPLYKQIPFYICKNSIGSYGIFYDTYSNGEIDFGREHNNYYDIYKHFFCEEDSLVYYVIFGTVEEIVERFTYLTGKSFLPPKWSFKYCGSTMAYTDSNNPIKELNGFVDKCKEYDIDCGGFYLSSGYTQIGDKRCVFHWNKEKFPDPKGFADDLLKLGINFLPNIKPAFLTTHPLYEYIKNKGWFLHYIDGSPYVFPFWGGMGSYLDFTNDEAYDFWTKCVKENLVDLGYCSIWNDNNEYDIHDEEVYANGFGHPIKAKLIRPLFSLLMCNASNEAVDKTKRHMAVTRSASAGFQRVTQTWTGDNNTSFEDFRGNHKMAMTSALTGFAFIGQDIGGFAGEKPSEELFLRWIAYGIFTPRFTLHSWNPDGSSTMPWLYPSLKDKVMTLFELRKTLLPYLYSAAMNAVESYHPMIYPVFLKYPSFDEESDLYFCGDNILSAPIFDKGATKITVNLPDGNWYFNKDRLSGMHTFENKPGDLPIYFIKEGSVLPLLKEDKVIFNIYPLEKGTFSYKYYEDDSTLENPYKLITVESNENEVVIEGISDTSLINLIDFKVRILKLKN